MKKALTLLLSVMLVVTMTPIIAFANDGGSNSVHKWVTDDWQNPAGYGTAEQDAEENITIIKGNGTSGTIEQPNYAGPYSKVDDSCLGNGDINTVLNVYIDPEEMAGENPGHGDFTVTTSLDNSGGYMTEICVDFRCDGNKDCVVSFPNKTGKITKPGVYSIHWNYSAEDRGEGFIIWGKADISQNGKEICSSDKMRLIDYSNEPEQNKENISTRSVWFVNVDIKNGLRVFTELPAEKTFQNPVKYESSNWITQGGYGDIEKIEADGSVYKLLAGDKGENGYPVGPYTKRGNLSFDDGNLAQELNAYVNVEDEESFIKNGVKFAFAVALNKRDGNRSEETSYVLQKTEDRVAILGTGIVLKKSGVYTFRVENTRAIDGTVTAQLKVLQHGEVIGEDEIKELGGKNCDACGHRYLWLNYINVTDGITVYKNAPIPMELCDVEINGGSDYTFSGKAVCPAVSATFKGNEISYATKYSNNVSIGKAKVVITGKDQYVGEKTITYNINPTPKKLKKVTKGKKKFTARWAKTSKKNKNYISGYQIRYSKNKNFSSNVNYKTKKGWNKTNITVKKLGKKTTYYVQLRTYKTVGGVNYYSTWSATKKIKTR